MKKPGRRANIRIQINAADGNNIFIGGIMSKKTEVESSDVLVGMKAICNFLNMSDATVLKYCREYDDFPVKKNGVYVSSRTNLNNWFRAFVAG